MNLIGISGTNGSGKDTLGQILMNEYGFMFISVTDILRDELIKRDLPLSRENMRQLSSEWRQENSLGILVDKALKIFKPQATKYRGLSIASLRNPGEVDRVHELGGKVVWVDAEPRIRFERIQANSEARGAHRSIDDDKTFTQFLADEEIEMHSSGDQTTLNMSAVKLGADIFIENNSDNIELFLQSIKNIIGL